MKTLLIYVMVAVATAKVQAQITAYWKGGKPGCPNEWNCPANWSNYRIPDSFTDVFILANENIPCHYPVIHEAGCEANSLHIQPNAYLTFEKKGTLRVWDTSTSQFETNQFRFKPGLDLDDRLITDKPWRMVGACRD